MEAIRIDYEKTAISHQVSAVRLTLDWRNAQVGWVLPSVGLSG
jgi:hypothetical protein